VDSMPLPAVRFAVYFDLCSWATSCYGGNDTRKKTYRQYINDISRNAEWHGVIMPYTYTIIQEVIGFILYLCHKFLYIVPFIT